MSNNEKNVKVGLHCNLATTMTISLNGLPIRMPMKILSDVECS